MGKLKPFSILLCLVLVTHLTVRGVMSAFSLGRPTAIGAISDAGETLVRSSPTDAQVPTLPRSDNPSVRASRGAHLIGVVPLGDGTVLFACDGRVYHRDTPGPYLWNVIVFDEEGARILEWPYWDRLFGARPGEERYTTLMDSLPHRLRPGDYVLEVTIEDPVNEPGLQLAASRRRFSVE